MATDVSNSLGVVDFVTVLPIVATGIGPITALLIGASVTIAPKAPIAVSASAPTPAIAYLVRLLRPSSAMPTSLPAYGPRVKRAAGTPAPVIGVGQCGVANPDGVVAETVGEAFGISGAVGGVVGVTVCPVVMSGGSTRCSAPVRPPPSATPNATVANPPMAPTPAETNFRFR
ncbi:hypothetical protein A5740_05030 [Mycobacterium sp. GA-1841]|nr:hypothetical protein A5740_05030 [Mycobacterium sp. GA-1841]